MSVLTDRSQRAGDRQPGTLIPLYFNTPSNLQPLVAGGGRLESQERLPFIRNIKDFSFPFELGQGGKV